MADDSVARIHSLFELSSLLSGGFQWFVFVGKVPEENPRNKVVVLGLGRLLHIEIGFPTRESPGSKEGLKARA